MTHRVKLPLVPLLLRSQVLAKLLQLAARHSCLSLSALQASRLLPDNLGELHSKGARRVRSLQLSFNRLDQETPGQVGQLDQTRQTSC